MTGARPAGVVAVGASVLVVAAHALEAEALDVFLVPKEDAVPRGGREAWKAFHDELLKFGAPPLPLVRRAMLGVQGDSPF